MPSTVCLGRSRAGAQSSTPCGHGSTSWGDEEVVAFTLATGDHKVLLKDASDARYVATGHLLFLRRGTLFAVPFDAERLEIRGTPVALLETIAQALNGGHAGDCTGAGQFAVSANRFPRVDSRPGLADAGDAVGDRGPERARVSASGPRAAVQR